MSKRVAPPREGGREQGRFLEVLNVLDDEVLLPFLEVSEQSDASESETYE